MARTWLLTGCSTGFGRLLTADLLARGENVVATARQVETLADIAPEKGQLLNLALDVTREDQAVEAVAAAAQRFGKLDVLVNNAGWGYFATQEQHESEPIEAMFATNVFGLARMTRLALPHLRAGGGGTVVNLSSVAGRTCTPRGGFYQATKWAVEAMSEALFYEASPLGIRVIVIEPGAFATDFGPRSAKSSPHNNDPASPYAALHLQWTEAAQKLFDYGQDAREVVKVLREAVESDVKFARIPVGTDATRIVREREARPGLAFQRWVHEVAGYGVKV